MFSSRAFLRVPRLPLALAAVLVAALLPLGPSGPATAGAIAPTHTSVAGLLASPVASATTPRRASKARLALRTTRDGRRGGSAMKIRTHAKRPVTIPGRHRLAHRTPRGTGHTLRAWVRATTPGQRATLVGRELLDGSSLQKRSRSKKLRRGSWVRIDVPVRTRHHRSTFGIRLNVSSRRPGKGKVKVDDVVVVIPPEPETCRIDPRGIPSCGAYLGMTYGSNTEPSEAEAEFGGTVAVRRTFFRHDNTAKAITTARGDLEKGRLPWMSFKMPHSWDRMAAGDGDAWTRDLVARLADLPGPVWIAFHHEPEGDGPIGDWRRMQERLGPIVRTAPNVGFTVIVTGWHQFYGDAQYSLDNIWPRNTTVDVAGFDIYNPLGMVKDGKENTTGADLPKDYFDKIVPWAKKQGVAWGLPETGYTHKAAEIDPQWITRTYRDLDAAGGVAFAYFNTELNNTAPWPLSTQTKKDDFARALTGTLRLTGR